jgi:hypothetical protein
LYHGDFQRVSLLHSTIIVGSGQFGGWSWHPEVACGVPRRVSLV